MFNETINSCCTCQTSCSDNITPEYKKLLENNNFKVECIEIIPRKTKLDTDIKGWLKTFANNFFVDIDKSQYNEIVEKIEQNLKDKLFEDGDWYADYVRLRFKAIRV